MTLRRHVRLWLFLASVACLASAFALAGLWVGAGLTLVIGASFPVTAGFRASWMPSAFLWAVVCLAAAGVLAGAAAFPMILAVSLALAAWDVMSFDLSLGGDVPPLNTRAPVNRRHLLLLAGASTAGLGLAAVGIVVSFSIPFPVMLVIAALSFVGLDRVVRQPKKSGQAHPGAEKM